jgi:hypothetical protein
MARVPVFTLRQTGHRKATAEDFRLPVALMLTARRHHAASVPGYLNR